MPPEATVERLERILGERYDYRLVEERIAPCLHWSALFVDALGFRAMGKGVSPLMSRAGALAEAAEWLTARDVARLPGYAAVHPDHVAGPRLTLEDMLRHVDVDAAVVERLKALDTAHYWVDGWSLIDRRTVKVPVEYARLISGPNGIAAGNRIEEAIVHALNEIFERRAHITVLRRRLTVPTIDPATIDDAVVRDQMAFLSERKIRMTVKDLSFGGVLPCIGVYFRDPAIPRGYQFRHALKVGAAFDRVLALRRALTEYVQGRRLDEFIDGRPAERDRVLRHDFRALRCMADDGDNYLSAFMFGFVPMEDAAFLEAGATVAFDPGVAHADCLVDIAEALAVCRTLGLDVVVVDRTDPEIGFPVVQAIVPGYSDVLPFHPATSPGLFRALSREEILRSYGHDIS